MRAPGAARLAVRPRDEGPSANGSLRTLCIKPRAELWLYKFTILMEHAWSGADVNKRGGSYNGYARTPLEVAIIKWETNPNPRHRRLWPILLDAGATLPARFVAQHPYLHMIAAAGGFRAYEKSHRQSFVELLAPEFPLLPREMVSHIVSFYAHTGYY